MNTFQWSSVFETGIDTVDEQHRKLVDSINLYSEKVTEDRLDAKSINSLVGALSEYAQFHFQDEEKLMEERGLDQRHLKAHKDEHADFLSEVGILHSGLSFDRAADVQHLLEFLIHWLAYHILGADQNMARQVESIDSGTDSATAYIQQEIDNKKVTEPLVVALNSLFSLVSARNRDLVRLNESLERKVEDRTQELRTANRRLEELALTDTLTGLYNRRYAMRALQTLWEEAGREGHPLGCMMIDADNFKIVNDTHGHDAGDEVLKKLSSTLKHNLRTDDILCRLGGDEFFVLCPKTGSDGLQKVAESLLHFVNQLEVPVGNDAWKGQVSIGTAVKSTGMADIDELIKSADRGVYAAKEAGRNCVRPDPEQPIS